MNYVECVWSFCVTEAWKKKSNNRNVILTSLPFQFDPFAKISQLYRFSLTRLPTSPFQFDPFAKIPQHVLLEHFVPGVGNDIHALWDNTHTDIPVWQCFSRLLSNSVV